MAFGQVSIWNDELVARLKALWAEGVKTTAIAAELGIPGNAVIGKAYRLKLARHKNANNRLHTRKEPPKPRTEDADIPPASRESRRTRRRPSRRDRGWRAMPKAMRRSPNLVSRRPPTVLFRSRISTRTCASKAPRSMRRSRPLRRSSAPRNQPTKSILEVISCSLLAP